MRMCPKKMSFAPQFEITNSVTAELTRIERARGFLDAAKLSEDWIAGMQKRALVLEAHYTTHIEGTQLTLEQSERILAGQKVRGPDRMMRKSSSITKRRLNWFQVTWRAASQSLKH